MGGLGLLISLILADRAQLADLRRDVARYERSIRSDIEGSDTLNMGYEGSYSNLQKFVSLLDKSVAASLYRVNMDLPPILRQLVKAQIPLNGE